MTWKVVFYKDEDGNEPVKDFILQQPHGAIAEIIHVFDLLHRFDISLSSPYVEKIKGKIWSLRIKHSTDYYRILYSTFPDKKFILLHAIKKKRDNLTNQDILRALERLKDHESCYSASND